MRLGARGPAAALLAVLAAAVDLPGLNLADPPQTLNQVHQAIQIAQELAHLPPGGVEAPRAAVLNLYGNYTFTQIPPPMAYQNFIIGVRVQVRNGELFYAPVPAEVAGWLSTAPERYRDEFMTPASHALTFLAETLARHKVPDVDATFAIADFCFGMARAQPVVWGLGSNPLSEPPNDPPAALTSTQLPPVFVWSSEQSGRRTCNAVTTTSYDWTLPSAMPGVYEGPPWEQRTPVLGWRGSLIGDHRARLVRAALGKEGMDIKIAGGFECGKYVQEAGAFGATMQDCTGPAAVTAAFVEMPNQQKWKYILDVDGGASTWRFKSLLNGGWTIFKVDSPNGQFWYSQMVPFVHYIPVDAQRLEEDLPAKLAWARAHDDEAKQIALNAKAFAVQHLTWDSLHWQQYAALALYAQKLAHPVEPDPALSRFCCKDVSVFPHLAAQCKEAPACAAEPAHAGFVREDWKEWGAVQPTAFAPWWSVPTEQPTATPQPMSFLRR